MITDFYKKSKICICKWTATLLESAIFAIHFEDFDISKDIIFEVPPSFRISEYYKSNEYGSKSDEANVLFSYLNANKYFIIKDREISEKKFDYYMAGLNLVMEKNYLDCNWFRKVWKIVGAYIRLYEAFLATGGR